ncbi:MAG TPA: pilus assembly protein TadG-related protein [Candidatus Sulfotelmatobacter sp.]|nr:pilus assembly protein TadG-related protein [Candidatus Sulfotelmatobacter sp.]
MGIPAPHPGPLSERERGKHAQRGQAIVLIAIMLAVIVGMAALAIDGSRAYASRRDLQAAVDAAALAAADSVQQNSSYSGAEQAAASIFGTNLRLYSAPSCAPGYGSPGALPYTVTCTYSDGTTLTDVVSNLGPQGISFRLTASRTLQLQFARILSSGGSPNIAGTASSGVNNLAYSPVLAALGGAGCGGLGGTALTVNGTGTLSVVGDVVANGSISVAGGSLRVAGDTYARCQASVPGLTAACYPSGAATPCTYPDLAGATRTGFRLADPGYSPPAVPGGSQAGPGSTVVLQPGTYAANPNLGGGCWFLSGGVYMWQAGFTNSLGFVSNELKPPDEPQTSNVRLVSSHQFWNTNGVKCSGSFQVNDMSGANPIENSNVGVVLTSVRTDSYNGMSYRRESAPSACKAVHVNSNEVLQVQVSNVPGATSYNVYVSTTASGCNGPWGLVGNIPVAGTVSNANTNPCPMFTGNGCTLGHETAIFDGTLISDFFVPNSLAAPDTYESLPPDSETAPLAVTLPNQNPANGTNGAGDRANENACQTVAGAFAACPAAITPGAVELYVPRGGCLTSSNNADTYVFSGYQYDWISVYEPGAGSPPANTCSNTVGAAGNSAYVGLFYAPSAGVVVQSQYTFETAGTGGLIASTVTVTGAMPAIAYSANYAPVPPASRLTA